MAKLDCRLAAALDRQSGALGEVLQCGGELVPEPWRVAMGLSELAKAPAKDSAKRVEAVVPYLKHPSAQVQLAALEVLAENASPSAADLVRPMIESKDPMVAAAAAGVAGKLKDGAATAAIRQLAAQQPVLPDTAETIARALADLNAQEAQTELKTWLSSDHAHVRNAAAVALTRLGGAPVAPERVERSLVGETVNAPQVFLPRDATLLFKTEKGEIEVQLYTAEATLTATNIFGLAQKGTFNNLTFHRIEPNFVAQGGDPRGDGEGGPGYTVRCEINRRPYMRGVVGMALSGKDTGGSQFFITLSQQPHLDGRYTAFGEVVKGMEVADRLLEGDRMLEVKAMP
jgi:cyclophilin family peptidyl-prolyl cis-trans isomerase